ncbi:MAG: helix-turn-helix transcriptional regulator [Sphingomonadaceae bacterium]
MTPEEERAALAGLIEVRGDDYAALSRLIGRNSAYIQQYLKRGTPRRLNEEDRGLLARYFGVPDSALGGPADARGGSGYASVPRRDIGASAGPGRYAGEEAATGHFGFDRAWLRRLAGGDASRLSLIRVEGDSMLPTLAEGDEILVHEGDAAERLRDGIYVLRTGDSLLVKRIALAPDGRRAIVRSDNPAYPPWPPCAPGELCLIGRVIWAGRRIA